jgi:hypothetical protein
MRRDVNFTRRRTATADRFHELTFRVLEDPAHRSFGDRVAAIKHAAASVNFVFLGDREVSEDCRRKN